MNPHHEESACLYVLDRLDASERAAFEARLLHDPALTAFVHELESTLARRLRALPRHEPPAGLFSGIEARLDRLSAGDAITPARPEPVRWVSFARWGLAAVLAIGVGIIAVQQLRRPPAAGRPVVLVVGLDTGRSTLTELHLPDRPQNDDARFIQLASLAEQYWEKPGGLPVQPGTGDQGGRGYALFDPGSNQGFIAIQRLAAAAPGQSYHLWILDTASGQTREAGVLPLTSSNRGLYFFSVDATAGEKPSGRLDFFVTAEDAAAAKPARPRGKVVLGDRRI